MADYEGDRAPARIQINPPLPCGFSGCGRPATVALAEPSPDDPALWQLLPVCDTCMTQVQATARATAKTAQQLAVSDAQPQAR